MMGGKILLVALCCVCSFTVYSQVGIGTTNPQAQLDIRASNQANPANTDGILIPKVNNFPSTNPTATHDGMLVYATGIGTPTKGFYYWDNDLTLWVTINGAKKIDDLIDGKSDSDGTQNGSSVFLGLNAGINDNSTGNKNVGVGYNALTANTTGYQNTAVGYDALSSNYNIGVGAYSLHSNTIGYQNTAMGYRALENNINGYRNTAIGSYALRNNTSGYRNVAISNEALSSNTTGDYNLAIGSLSLGENTTGNYNIAFGSSALRFNNADKNVAIGYYALRGNTDGTENIAIGEDALTTNTTGDNLIAIGSAALENNTTANNNVAIGVNASQENTTGFNNTALGVNALTNNQTGDNNVVIGKDAGHLILGNNNVIIGSFAGRGVIGGSPFNMHNSVFIGFGAGYQETNSDRLYIENSFGTTPLIGGNFSANRVGINRPVGSLTNTFEVGGNASKSTAGDWIANSDRRLKKNIKAITGASALNRLTQLQGVSYFWNDTQTGNTRPEGIQYGFIAQDLMQVFPELVTKDNQGFYQTAYGTYDAFYVEAIKTLNNQLDKKSKKVKLLEARLKQIEELLLVNEKQNSKN